VELDGRAAQHVATTAISRGGDVMAKPRKASVARGRRRANGAVGKMLGELEGRTASGDRSRIWTVVQPANVKSGKVCA